MHYVIKLPYDVIVHYMQVVKLVSGISTRFDDHLRFVVFVCLQDISLFYQIFPDDVLGSGQFGTVYGGERPT